MHETNNTIQFAQASLAHTYYYETDRGQIAPMDVSSALQDIGLTYERPLLFTTSDPDAFSHMVTARTPEKQEVKVRVCFSEASARQIYANVQHATDLGVRTPQALRHYGRLVILEFAEGENLEAPTLEQVRQAGTLYAGMNEQLAGGTESTSERLGSLVGKALAATSSVVPVSLSAKVKNAITQHAPSQLLPVFDHQDIGLHNMLVGPDGDLILIDEEAFGVLPFGVTLDKALNDQGAVGICKTEAEQQQYLTAFPESLQEYYNDTQHYWRLVNTLRLAARFVAIGNKGGDQKAAELLGAVA